MTKYDKTVLVAHTAFFLHLIQLAVFKAQADLYSPWILVYPFITRRLRYKNTAPRTTISSKMQDSNDKTPITRTHKT